MRVHIIDLEFQGFPELIASFLIETGEGLIIVEPGPGSTRETHLRKIAELGFDPANVSAVFITHAHLDHCGAGGWWAEQGATLYVHPKAEKHIVDPTRLVESARGVFRDRFDKLWGETLPASADKVRVMADGERVEIGGVGIEAISTPGHAFHHHAFALDDGTLFTGDVAGMRLPGSDYFSVTSAPPQFHLESYLDSIDRLRERGFQRLMLTHFGEVLDVDGHWDRYRARVVEVAEKVKWWLGQTEEGPGFALPYLYNLYEHLTAKEAGVDKRDWERYQTANNAGMCIDGLRIYWERKDEDGKA